MFILQELRETIFENVQKIPSDTLILLQMCL